jgi:FAD/FMN-containing dehydrogenase
MGWNGRGWGWAAESIVAIDAVTADGLTVHCSEEINSDLFWAARGSGPGFFVAVTRFHLQSRVTPAGMLSNMYIWDISEYDTIMPWIIDKSRSADANMEITAFALYLDNSETAPVDQRLSLVVLLMTFNFDTETAHASLEAFASTVPRKDVTVMVKEYQIASIEDEFVKQYKSNPTGHRYCADNAWLHNLSTNQLVDVMRDAFNFLPSIQTYAMYYSLAPERMLPDMAFSLQTEHYFGVYCIWKCADDDEKYQSWMRDLFLNIHEFSPGVYIGDSDFQVRKAKFLARGRWERLESIRAKWDPKRRFCGYLGLEKE